MGTWPIRTINGSVVPAIVAQANGHTVRISSDTLFLRKNGSFLRATVTEDSSQGSFGVIIVKDVFAGGVGTFTLSGNVVTLAFQGDRSSVAGVVSVNTVTFTRAGSTFVFEKR